MKKFVAFIFLLIFLFNIKIGYSYITANAIIIGNKEIKAGITPDSFLYFLDKALDNLSLLFIFDPAEKAKKSLEIARERLLEVREMILQNKTEFAKVAASGHKESLNLAKQVLRTLRKENSTATLENILEIEREIEFHEDEVENFVKQAEVEIKVKGQLTPQIKNFIDSLLNQLQNNTFEIKIEIENRKNEIKIEIERETGKSEEEVEIEINRLEKKYGVFQLKLDKILERIEDARENLDEISEILIEMNVSLEELPEIKSLVDNSNDLIEKAEKALEEEKIGEAFGLANAAKRNSENALELLERITGIEFEEEEVEFDIEFEGGVAIIDLEIGESSYRIRLNATKPEQIFDEVERRTGINREELIELIQEKLNRICPILQITAFEEILEIKQRFCEKFWKKRIERIEEALPTETELIEEESEELIEIEELEEIEGLIEELEAL